MTGRLGRQLVVFAAVGGCNSAVTLAVIFCAQLIFGLSPVIANAIGYCVGILSSIALNAKLTFQVGRLSPSVILRFAGIFATAYAANASCVYGLQKSAPVLSHFCGMAVYTTLSFAGCRLAAAGLGRRAMERVTASS